MLALAVVQIMEEVPWVFADQKKSHKLEAKDKGKDCQDVAATLLITMASDTLVIYKAFRNFKKSIDE